MINNTKQIVVLDNIESSHIEQAIFILRDNSSTDGYDAVEEAERIVSSYLTMLQQPLLYRKKHHSKYLFLTALTVAVSATAVYLILSSFMH